MIKQLSDKQRKVTSETMESVLTYVPTDGFKLTDETLNKMYTTTSVDEYDIGKTKSFSVTMESDDGDVITISASALKRARLMKPTTITEKTYKKHKDVFLRSESNQIWNASTYMHKGSGMKKDDEFIVPAQFKLRYAILTEDQDSGDPILNPYLMKGFRKVVREYLKKEEYPSTDDFREELNKSKADGRFPFLPAGYTTPEKYGWVKEVLADFKYTLVFEEIVG